MKTARISRIVRMFFLIFIGILIAGNSYATNVIRGEKITIEESNIVNDDLYLFGSEIIINGQINGDLTVFGRFVSIHGEVTGDLMVAAQAIKISGNIGDDMRLAGQVLSITDNAMIGDDIIFFGFSSAIYSGVNIGGDITFYGYQMLIDGRVQGNITGSMDRMTLNGMVDGNMDVEVSGEDLGKNSQIWMMSSGVEIPTIEPGFNIGNGASVMGRMHYKSTSEAHIDSGANIGEISFEKDEKIVSIAPANVEEGKLKHEIQWKTLIGDTFKKAIGLFLIGIILVWLIPSIHTRWSEAITTHTLASFGWGLLGLVGIWASIVLIVILGIVLAIFFIIIKLGSLAKLAFLLGIVSDIGVIAGYFIWARYIAYIVMAYWFGNLLINRSKPLPERGKILTLIVGILIVTLLSMIPFIGTLIHYLLIIFSLGSLILLIKGDSEESDNIGINDVPNE